MTFGILNAQVKPSVSQKNLSVLEKNGSYNYQEQNGKPPHGTGNGPENRPQAGNVQKLNQENLPPRHGNVIHAIGHGNSRSWPVAIGAKCPFNIFGINEIPTD